MESVLRIEKMHSLKKEVLTLLIDFYLPITKQWLCNHGGLLHQITRTKNLFTAAKALLRENLEKERRYILEYDLLTVMEEADHDVITAV